VRRRHDYGIGHNQLAALAADIRSLHSGIRRSAEQIARDAIEAGRQLIEAKSKLQHGQWESWLRDHVAIRPRTARLYMQVARSGRDIGNVADLGLAAAAKATDEAEIADRLRGAGRNALASIVAIGKELTAAKEQVGDEAKFRGWVADEFGWVRRSVWVARTCRNGT